MFSLIVPQSMSFMVFAMMACIVTGYKAQLQIITNRTTYFSVSMYTNRTTDFHPPSAYLNSSETNQSIYYSANQYRVLFNAWPPSSCHTIKRLTLIYKINNSKNQIIPTLTRINKGTMTPSERTNLTKTYIEQEMIALTNGIDVIELDLLSSANNVSDELTDTKTEIDGSASLDDRQAITYSDNIYNTHMHLNKSKIPINNSKTVLFLIHCIMVIVASIFIESISIRRSWLFFCFLLFGFGSSQGSHIIWCDDMSNYSSTGWTGSYLSTSTSTYCSSPPCLYVSDSPSTVTKLNINASVYSSIYLSYDIRWTNTLDSGEYIDVRYSCTGGTPPSSPYIKRYLGSNSNILSPVWDLSAISGGACDFSSAISISFRIQASIESFYLDNVCLTAHYGPPTSPPTSNPTTYPTISPSSSTLSPTTIPTLSPTTRSQLYPFQYINKNNASCNDLVSNIGIGYDITLSNCSIWCDTVYDCKMFNYFEHFKAVNDSRCYIFEHLCDIKIENNHFISVIGYYGFKHQCLNYPESWKDNTGDDCNYYESYNWCNSNGTVRDKNDFYNFIDDIYQLTAMDTCCECGGGTDLMDNVAFSIDNDWEGYMDDIQCSWIYSNATSNKTNVRNWDRCIFTVYIP